MTTIEERLAALEAVAHPPIDYGVRSDGVLVAPEKYRPKPPTPAPLPPDAGPTPTIGDVYAEPRLLYIAETELKRLREVEADRDRLARRVGELDERFRLLARESHRKVEERDEEIAALRSKLAEAEQQLADPRVPHVFQERVDALTKERDALKASAPVGVSEAMRAAFGKHPDSMKWPPVRPCGVSWSYAQASSILVGYDSPEEAKAAMDAWGKVRDEMRALSTGSAILMPREERDALIQRAIDAEDKLASHITRAAKFVQYPDPEPASAVEAAERHLGSCQAQLAIAHSERDAARRELAEAVSVLDELASAASEQQFTLNSKGWNVGEGRPWSKDPDWSKAGAQRHQYDRIEAVLARVTPIVEGHPAAQRPGGADVERALLVKLYAWAANETDGGRIDLRDAAREAIFARPAPPSHAEARDDVPRAGMLAEDGTLPMVPSGWTPELVRKFNERGRSLATPEPRAAESAISDFELGRLVVGEYQLADNRGVGGKAALAEAGKKARALLSRDARPARAVTAEDLRAAYNAAFGTTDPEGLCREADAKMASALNARLNPGTVAREARDAT